MTEKAKTEQGVVCYDDTCDFCRTSIKRLSGLLHHYGFAVTPLVDGANADEVKLITNDQRVIGGADAIVFAATKIWWAWPLTLLTRLPGVMPILRIIYRHIAANRHCANGKCTINPTADRRPRITVATIFIVGVALVWTQTMPGYPRMWLFAVISWLAFKWFAKPTRAEITWWLWPGMDTRTFKTTFPKWALLRTFAGVLLIWVVARHTNPLLAGWFGITGMLLILHFGTFEVLGWALRVRPIMDAPWNAGTLTAFWGNRWNRAFSDVTRVLLFRPLVRKLGPAVGIITGFAFSGLLHELVISVPAGAGYGLPTGYFLLQGGVVLLERRMAFAPSRLRVWLVVVGPAFWLFHPAFMTKVITPMLTAIHAY